MARSLLDDQAIRDRLLGLSKYRKIAFGLMVCDRLMRCLERFSQDTGFDIGLYRACVAEGWQFLEHGQSGADFWRIANDCLRQAPHAAGADHFLNAAALDATQAVGNVMAYIHGHDDEVILEIVGLAVNTIATYVAATEPSRNGGSPVGHALAQQELRRQAADLAFLALLPEHQKFDNIGQIRRRAESAPDMIP